MPKQPADMRKPTRAEAFEAGRMLDDWMKRKRISKPDMGPKPQGEMLAVLLPPQALSEFFGIAVVDLDSIKRLTLEGQVIDYDFHTIQEAIRRIDSSLPQWLTLGREFSETQKERDGKWISRFRRSMQDAEVSPDDREKIVDWLLQATVPGVDKHSQDEAFDRAAEHLRDCAKVLEAKAEEGLMDRNRRPVNHPATQFEKFGVLLVLLVFALFGFYLFSTAWWLVFLWLAFFVIALPLVWVFVFRAEAVPGSDLKTIYQTGVQSIPIIGRLFVPSSQSPDPATKPSHEPDNR